MSRSLWLGVAATLVLIAPKLASGDQEDIALKLLADAYGAPKAFKLVFVDPAAFEGPVPDEIAKSLPDIPGVTKVAMGGADWWALQRTTVLWSNTGAFRLEREALSAGGPRERRTSIEVSTRTSLTKADSLIEQKCVHDLLPALNLEEQVSYLARGMVPHERLRAQADFGCLAPYALSVFSQAKDVKVEWDGVSASISSESSRLSLRISRNTGEIISATFRDPGASVVQSFQGSFETPVFPARHPRERRCWYPKEGQPDPDVNSVPGALRIYESLTLVEEPDAALFEWKSVAPKAFDSFGRDVAPDGSAIGERPKAAPQVPVRPTYTVSEDKTKLIPVEARRSLASNLLIAGGIAAVAIGAAVWFRRRLST